MGGRQGRSSVWVVALTSFVFPSFLWAQEEMPPGKRALFDAAAKAKTVPLDQGVKLYEQVITQFPDTVYAGQALLNIGSLYLQNKLPEKALANAEQALEEYGETYLAGQAIRRKFVTLANALNQPQEALDFLDEVLDQFIGKFTATDRMWLPVHRYDAYRKLGDREAALSALTEAIVEYPQVLDGWEFQRRYVPALRDLGQRAKPAREATLRVPELARVTRWGSRWACPGSWRLRSSTSYGRANCSAAVPRAKGNPLARIGK